MNLPPAEFRAFYESHFDFVWRSLRRLGAREADTMDLAQKVFLAAFRKLPEFEGRARTTTWLFAICHRVVSDYRRSAAFRREVATDVDELNGRVELNHAEASGESRQSMRLAEAILSKLPEPQRVVFVLFELEEMSGQDIAALLDVPIGTVRSRLRLARECFRREVKRLSAAGPAKEAV